MSDLTAVASAISQAELSSKVSVAVAKKAMDAQRREGEAALTLLRAAAQTGKGGPGSSGVAGLGELVDSIG